jgi:hypothetical protein
LIQLKAKVAVVKLRGIVQTVPKTLGAKLQVKTVFPAYEEQHITADEDYDGLSLVVVMPKPRPLQETFLTSGYYNLVVSANDFAPGGSLELTILGKYSYNGVLLPEIPADVLAQYPYAWIRKNKDGITYDLVFSEQLWYYKPYFTTNASDYVWYVATVDSNSWAYKQNKPSGSSINFGAGGGAVWSNHDIPNGSETATEIYFEGSEPVPV